MDRQTMRHQLEDRDERAAVDPFDGLPGCEHPGDPLEHPSYGFTAWTAPATSCHVCGDDIEAGDHGAEHVTGQGWRCWECRAVAEDDAAELGAEQDGAPVVARRVTVAAARRHFAAGGAVLVSDRGHEATVTVGPDTTTHDSTSTTWAELVDQVKTWRGRYPNQRFYVI